jgi:hypothetical protein
LEAQLAAVVEAEAALAKVHALCGSVLPVRSDQNSGIPKNDHLPLERAREARTELRDPPERVLGVPGSQRRRGGGALRDADGPQSASKICPGCGGSFVREMPAQRYCNERCRIRLRNQRAYQAKRARADAQWRERTAQLRQLHEREGFVPNGEAGHAKSEEKRAL